MGIKLGQTVIHPRHGTALVEGLETRRVSGEDTTFVVLRATGNDLVMRIPAANLERVGVRAPLDKAELDRLLAVLAGRVGTEASEKAVDEEMSWAQRCRTYAEAMGRGDAFEVAAVLRDLWRRGRQQPLSGSERRLLTKAREVLLAQISVSARATPAQPAALVQAALESETATSSASTRV